MTKPRLEVRGLRKAFSGAPVLRDIDLEVAPGEVHGLIGQNGSGKSTLIKLISGFLAPDAGELHVDGVRLRLPSRPSELQEHCVSFVHQDLGLVPALSVVENVRLGRFRGRRISRRIDWRAEARSVAETFDRLGAQIPLWAPVSSLSLSQRAVVALARALQGHREGAGCIVLDESTQALPRETLPEFYTMIREFTARGTSFIAVSHRLDEVVRMTDRVTVLRDGVVVDAGVPTASTSARELTRAMLGRELLDVELRADVPTFPGKTVAQFRDIAGDAVTGIDLEVRSGEVLGITGVTDSGVGDLPALLTGARSGRGTVRMADGRDLRLGTDSVRAFMDAGLALVPADRATSGLALPLSVLDNVSLSRLREHLGIYVSPRWQREDLRRMAEDLDIRPPRGDQAVGRLSGGNQQKVLLAKWLLRRPVVLVVHEPTQAVDVGARRDLLIALREAARAGTCVVICSVEAEDLAQVCDRVLVMAHGRLHTEAVGELSAANIADRVEEMSAI